SSIKLVSRLRGGGSMKKTTIISTLLTLAALSPLAEGQDQAARAPVVYAAPPAAFDPTFASDSELAEYGFPPRPDRSEPALYARWEKLVKAPQSRLTNVTVQTTNIVNGG